MTVCVISQPRFFPGLHYLHRMMLADVFVVLDTVQYSPRHEENRTRVKTAEGPQWLSVPVRQSSREQLILDTRIDGTRPWQRKIAGTLAALYTRAPRYEAHITEVLGILNGPHEALTDLDQASWGPAVRRLGITCRFVRASTLGMPAHGSRLLLEICRAIGAGVYLSGAFGREYLDLPAFAAAGIEARFHAYTYPQYPQRFGAFVPWLSFHDMLFNAGLDPAAVAAGGAAAAPVAVGGGARG